MADQPAKRKRDCSGVWKLFDIDDALEHLSVCKLCNRKVTRGCAKVQLYFIISIFKLSYLTDVSYCTWDLSKVKIITIDL